MANVPDDATLKRLARALVYLRSRELIDDEIARAVALLFAFDCDARGATLEEQHRVNGLMKHEYEAHGVRLQSGTVTQ